MDSDHWKGLGRRDFLKYSLLTAGAAVLPGAAGCSTKQVVLPEIDYAKPVVLTNCHLLDVVSGNMQANQTLTIKGGLIESITGEGNQPVSDASVLDLNGMYVIPGLIDAHCHSTVSPVFNMSMFDLFKHARQQKRNYINSIESGITTIRDMGGFPGLLNWFISDIESGELPGPRVVYCNSILNIKGGHPEIPPSDVNLFAEPASWFVGMVMNNFRDMEEMKRNLEKNAKGASFIKLTMDNKSIFCKSGNIPVYDDDHLKEIFRFADKTGLPVVCHHHHKFGFDRSMEYPVHSMEHIVSDAVLTDEDVNRMVNKNVSIVPTMTVGQSFLIEEAYDEIPSSLRSDIVDNELAARRHYLNNEAIHHCDPALHKSNMNMLSSYKRYGKDNLWKKKKFLVDPDLYFGMVNYGSQNLKKMKEAGVLIGCGIDAGMPFCYFGGMYREYEMLSRLGFSNHEIIRCATLNNAKILSMENKAGSIEPGKYADLVVYDKNPLKDITVLRKPAHVFKEGKMMHSDRTLARD